MFKKFIKGRIQRKTFIILVIISNVLFLLGMSYTLYFRELLFDKSKLINLNSNEIIKIEIRDGMWKWGDKVWPMTRGIKLTLANRTDIEVFCKALESLPSKYIDNVKPIDWLYIYIINNENEIFVEYKGHTYDGTKMAELIKSLSDKYH